MSCVALRDELRRAPGVVVALALTVAAAGAGCSYSSRYVPPADGRARPVWRGDDVAVDLGGAPEAGECARDVRVAVGGGWPGGPEGTGYGRVGGYWAPRYYGPSLYVVTPGLAPRPPSPILFSPSIALARAAVSGGGGGGGVGGLRLGGGGGGGGSGSNEAIVYAMIVALLVLPAVDLALAYGPAESPGASSRAIDRVNAMNDLMRSPGNACSYAAWGATP